MRQGNLRSNHEWNDFGLKTICSIPEICILEHVQSVTIVLTYRFRIWLLEKITGNKKDGPASFSLMFVTSNKSRPSRKSGVSIACLGWSTISSTFPVDQHNKNTIYFFLFSYWVKVLYFCFLVENLACLSHVWGGQPFPRPSRLTHTTKTPSISFFFLIE